MSPYLKITGRTITIWLLASLINGVLCATYFGIGANELCIGSVLLLIIVSLILAIPGFILFWIYLMIIVSRKVYARALFRTALSTGLILSLIYMVLGSIWLQAIPPADRYTIIAFTVISVLASIILHFKHLKNIHN